MLALVNVKLEKINAVDVKDGDIALETIHLPILHHIVEGVDEWPVENVVDAKEDVAVEVLDQVERRQYMPLWLCRSQVLLDHNYNQFKM